MKIGVVFPQTEIGSDPGAIREYVQAAESLGYDHILAFDHVLGVDTTHYKDWQGFYDIEDQFHEPFVLFGYIAAMTQRIGLVTGIIILPQRQTVLVAKQAAEVDVLSNGRLRLGIGTGWNAVEFEALGENFHNRGKRSEEQISLMRDLWTRSSVTFSGDWHNVNHAGLNPMPVQRPIPIWLGGGVEPVLRRVGRLADGWISSARDFKPNEEFRLAVERIHNYALEAGRDPTNIGVQCVVVAQKRTPDEWVQEACQWESFGATNVSLNTMGANFKSPDEHIDAIRRFKEALI